MKGNPGWGEQHGGAQGSCSQTPVRDTRPPAAAAGLFFPHSPTRLPHPTAPIPNPGAGSAQGWPWSCPTARLLLCQPPQGPKDQGSCCCLRCPRALELFPAALPLPAAAGAVPSHRFKPGQLPADISLRYRHPPPAIGSFYRDAAHKQGWCPPSCYWHRATHTGVGSMLPGQPGTRLHPGTRSFHPTPWGIPGTQCLPACCTGA